MTSLNKHSLIWLDAGHGGHDSGALSPSRLKESDVVLTVCLMAKSKLEQLGLMVGMSRASDVFFPVWQRAKMANDAEAAFFVSVHANSAETVAAGIETFAMPRSEEGERLAGCLQDAQLDAFENANDRGVKFRADLGVLNKTRMPAALVELEFIHTEAGDAHFRDAKNLEKHADALVQGVLNYLALGYLLEGKDKGESLKDKAPSNETMKPVAGTTKAVFDALVDENEKMKLIITDHEKVINELRAEVVAVTQKNEDAVHHLNRARKALG